MCTSYKESGGHVLPDDGALSARARNNKSRGSGALCVCVCIKHDDPSLLTLGTRLARAHLCVCERVCVCVCKDNYSVPRRHRERELSGNSRDRKVAASSSSSWRRASSSAGLGVIRRSLLIKRRLKRVGPMRVSRNGLFFRALSASGRSIYKATARRSTSALSYFGWGAFQLSGAAATPTPTLD